MADTRLEDMTALSEAPANTDLLYLFRPSGDLDRTIAAGHMRRPDYDLVIATGDLALNAQHYVELSGAGAIALTITGAPTVGDVLEIYRVGTGVVNHTVVLSGSVTWDGSLATATFADDGDYLRAIAISATRWRVLPSSTGVAFS